MEWHPDKNNNLSPYDISGSSHTLVWWLGACGHEWEQTPHARNRKNESGKLVGCPYCSGNKVLAGFNDLAAKHPELAREWHPTKNGTLLPSQVTAGSYRKVFWFRESCGHSWLSSIANRTESPGCPVCRGYIVIEGDNDLATTDKELCEEWHPTKNGSLLPTEVHAGQVIKVWWKCRKCEYEWKALVRDRTTRGRWRPSGCSACNKKGGFNPSKEGYIYLIENKTLGLLKVGISNNLGQRIKEHRKNGFTAVLDTYGPANGKYIQLAEKTLKAYLNELLGISNDASHGKFNGYTESWDRDSYPVTKLQQLADDWYRQYRGDRLF